jgi:hypothetical protein
MFSRLSEMFNKVVDVLLADHVIPISQSTINTALSVMATTIPELTLLSMEIHDGSFDLLAEGKKVIAFKTRISFEVTSCEISAEKQVIVFRRISPTEIIADRLIDKILLLIFESIVCRAFNIEPANLILEGQPGVTVQAENYRVDLSQTNLSGQVTTQLKAALDAIGSLMRVKNIRCVPETIELLIGN